MPRREETQVVLTGPEMKRLKDIYTAEATGKFVPYPKNSDETNRKLFSHHYITGSRRGRWPFGKDVVVTTDSGKDYISQNELTVKTTE